MRIVKKEDKKYSFYIDEREIFESEIEQTSISNKMHIIINYINELMNNTEEFKKIFEEELISKYLESDNKIELLLENFEKIIKIIKEYEKKYNYSRFVDSSKIKSGSIVFSEDEIRSIMVCSGVLKILSIFTHVKILKLPLLIHKKIYNYIIEKTITNDIVMKLFNLIRTKVYRCSLTDKYMWEYIAAMRCHDKDCQIVSMFNFLMNYIIVLAERGKNPITFVVSTINEQLRWFLRTVYRDTFKYDDDVSINEPVTNDKMMAYSFNYAIGQILEVSKNKIYEMLNEECIKTGDNVDNRIIEFNNLLEKSQYVPPVSEYIVYPILSRALEIPHEYFCTLNQHNAILLNIYAKTVLEKVFSNREMPNLTSLLEHYPLQKPPIQSSLRLKQIQLFANNIPFRETIFGFISSAGSAEIIRSFVGKVARNLYINIFTGITKNWSQGLLEEDAMFFYLNFFNLRDDYIKLKVEQMKNIILGEI